MIDLHTHTLFSDGELLPSELVRRADIRGYSAIAITDHADASNIDFIVPRIVKVAGELNAAGGIKVIPGIELTHVPPSQIKGLIQEARRLGAKLVVVHGETPVEPVIPGTNRAAIESMADIIAHPGFIKEEDVVLAAKSGVYLEITARRGHNLTNGYVAKIAVKHGANMVLNSDSHAPSDLLDRDAARAVALGAGLEEDDIKRLEKNANDILQRVFKVNSK
ncbi:MAG: PHP domain-containing protein [Deltaproteobacteria bacterium GWC2_42_11]|nr:MAG: PHP domain-containing protein [Deltaproteobacteria bacterium GWC2_42_11]HBO85142.1 PHP domain-containing protein [Deltaproteobacteria bacterium]